MKDSELVYRAQSGDTNAIRLLVEDWNSKIYHFTFAFFSGNALREDHAADATQQTFIAMYRGLDSLQDIEKFKPWLYRIALNCCRNEARKINRKSVFSFSSLGKDDTGEVMEFPDANEINGQSLLQQEEQVDLLGKALMQLSEAQRTVVILKEYKGMTFKEIAETLEISENTAKSRMYYALTHLKKILDSWNITKETIYYEV